MLGVTVETLRRWETEGRLTMERSEGGQRLVAVEEISRLLDERRRASAARPIVAQSARNHFPGIVTRIERDRVAAVVEVQAGPHRLVSLMTAATRSRSIRVTMPGRWLRADWATMGRAAEARRRSSRSREISSTATSR